jgi:hypothetical protein
MNNYFDGIRTEEEEELILKDREKSLKRVESSTNPRVTGTMSRNGDQSRSRSGLRNNKFVKGGNPP